MPGLPPDRAPSLPLQGIRVLLVEDHADMRLALAHLLEHEGASVEVAVDGQDAMAKATALPYDVVLMDLHMPRMDGYDATRALRSTGFRTAIVMITADSASLHLAEVLSAGGDGCLSKPFTSAELLECVPALRYRRSGFQPPSTNSGRL